jgi:hypothetical protein
MTELNKDWDYGGPGDVAALPQQEHQDSLGGLQSSTFGGRHRSLLFTIKKRW